MADQPQNPAGSPNASANLEKEIADALGDFSVMDMMDEDPAPETAPTPVAHAGDVTMAKGRIAAIHDEDVFVDLDGKHQGIVPLNQFDKPPELGTDMEFVVEGVLGDEGLVKLSRQGAVEKATWQSLERGMTVEGKVSGSNTGGLELKIAGQRAFMPASQIDFNRVESFNDWLGQTLKCQVTELDRRAKRIIVSRRAVLEAEREAEKKKLLENLEVGQQLEGTVRSIQPYGAFVDLGGIDGLVHVSDMAYQRVNKPEEVVQVGQTVTVKVLKIEDGGERIALGMKQVGPDPWDAAPHKYTPGQTITGTVTKLTNFGAFVEVEPGIEGLIPMGEMSWQHVAKPSQVVQKGQSVTVKLLDIDADKQRMSLSLKQLSEDPWQNVDANYPVDETVKGTVTRTTDFGAFVELEPGVEGLIHISQLSDKRIDKVEHAVKEGQEVEAKVLDVDRKQRRISLSIKALIAPDAMPAKKANRQDMKKYVVSDKQARSGGQSLGALMDKFGGGDDNLKGGLG